MEMFAAAIAVMTGVLSILTVFVRLGQEKQSRIELERRHEELAREFRAASHSRERNVEKLIETEKSLIEYQTEVKNLRHRLAEKASVESVDSLREGMGRIEGTVTEMARRLDEIAGLAQKLEAVLEKVTEKKG